MMEIETMNPATNRRNDSGYSKEICNGQTEAKQLNAIQLGSALTTGLVCGLLAASICFNMTTISINNRRLSKTKVANTDFLPPIRPEELRLLNYDQFLEAHQVLHVPQNNEELVSDSPTSEATTSERGHLASLSSEQLIFAANLILVGRHNLAALSGLSTYYYHLSPQSLLQLSASWLSLSSPMCHANEGASEAAAAREQPVSGNNYYYSDKLQKLNIFNRLDKEWKRSLGYKIPNFPLDEQPDPNRITHIDADLRYCTGKIRNQHNCGACYAFSWLSMVEWHYCKQMGGNTQIDLSEQHLVDCGENFGLGGCQSGHICLAKDFTIMNGVHLESVYPYTGKKGACLQKVKEKFTQLNVTRYLPIKIDRHVFEETLKEQPILLEAHLPADTMQYLSGIHPGHNCDGSMAPHGMLLVGHGRQNGKPYWLLRNTHGESWGEQGYMRLSRDMSDMTKCFPNARIVRILFEKVDPDQYYDFYESIKYEPAEDKREPNEMRSLLQVFQGFSKR